MTLNEEDQEARRTTAVQRAEMTQLGYLGLLPFVIAAVSAWLAPWILPQWLIHNIVDVAVVYGGVIAAYMAGAGAGAMLGAGRPRESFLPGMIAALVAWIAIWPPMTGLELSVEWRCFLLIGVLVYLLLRDLRAVDAVGLPRWYGSLRIRLSFWACLSLAMIGAREFFFPYL